MALPIVARELAPAGLRSSPNVFGAASRPSGSKLPRHKSPPHKGMAITRRIGRGTLQRQANAA
ncbi:hypothetical protein EJA72_06480 [Pseudomonas sp. PB120]|nr:hypothetical protein [Pseudomonas sp. PB120]